MVNLSSICSIIVLSPLFSSIILGLFGTGFLSKSISKENCNVIAISGILISFIFSIFVFFSVLNNSIQIDLYTWNTIDNCDLQIGFMIDFLSSTMMLIVTFVSLMVHVYTIGYMHDDSGYQRFFSYISLFTFFMLILVMSNNMVQLFFGWEGVGLVSYLLIGFWYNKPTAVYANLKAFLINRVGDFGFLLGISIIYIFVNSFNYIDIIKNENLYISKILIFDSEISVLKLSCCFLFIGAMAKSAQIPLHSWLPDSMEGPTPISALIHAATMVTAGIFMIVRFSSLFELSGYLLSFIAIIGSLTALSMGILGILQNDIKRIIAYSTLSQLGYMMMAIGVSAYQIAIFHLLTHAFFKALLFLCAGSVIIGMHHEQDIRKMGNLYKYMPVTCITFLIGTLSLVGVPFLSGFYSKETIIEAVKLSSVYGSNFIYYSSLIGVLITSLYSFRLYILVFHKNKFSMILDKKNNQVATESSFIIILPLLILSIPSLFIGFFLVEPFLFGDYFKEIVPCLNNCEIINSLKLEWVNSIYFGSHALYTIPFWLMILGFVISLYLYVFDFYIPVNFKVNFPNLNKLLNNNYYFDWVNERIIARNIINVGNFFYKIIDKIFIDGFFVNGSAKIIRYFSICLSKIQSGYVYHYSFFMTASIAIMLTFLIIN